MFQRIRDLREDGDISQQFLADLLNVAQSTYSRYERDVHAIPMSSLIILANFYNTSIDYLVGRTNEKNPYPPKKVQL